jgi:hypothetical protein
MKSSEIGPRIRAVVRGRDSITVDWLLREVFGLPASEISPIRKAIAEAEMVDLGWLRCHRNSVWQRG